MKSIFLTLFTISLLGCQSTREIADYRNYSIPNSDFNDEINFPAIDYTDSNNWLFHNAKDNYQELLLQKELINQSILFQQPYDLSG